MQVSKYAYIQAKIQGMFAKAYFGDRLREILKLKQTSEIYSFLFSGDPPQVPEREMIVLLQKKITERNILTEIEVISAIDNPPDLLIHLLRRYEYRAVKALIREAAVGETMFVYINPIKGYGAVRDAENATIHEILAGSPYEWVLESLQSETPAVKIENTLDLQYYRILWEDTLHLIGKEKKVMQELVRFEILVQNLTWMLRLMVYFHKDKERTEELLIPIPDKKNFPEMLSVFSFSRDSVQEWKEWKYAWLLDDQFDENFRDVDPAQVEFRAIRALYKKNRRMFHSYPFTVIPVYCFFRLKEFETDILQSVLEGARISSSEDEILGLLGGI